MRKPRYRMVGAATALVALLGASACNNFLDVADPTVIDASTIDPNADLPTFASSALQNLFDAFDNIVVYSAWFSGEAYVGDTFPTRNDIGRRVVEFTNGTLDGEVYQPLELAISTNEKVLELANAAPTPPQGVLAKANFASAYAILLEAENFCEVVISSGLDNLGSGTPSDQAMQEAINRFQAAIDAGTQSGDADIVNASYVGMARAQLFRGEYAAAAAAAANVPADFEFMVPKADDPSYRGRLGNTVYSFTLARPSLVVPPYYRDLNDPRIQYALTVDGSGNPVKSQGNDFDFYHQTKYPGWDAPLRLSSGLEAQYISAEAKLMQGDPTEALALIAARNEPGSNSGDDEDFVADTGTLVQLLDQKARDFYLEAVHEGDWRRNPDKTPYVPPAGTPYYADAVGGTFGDVTCLPTPRAEVDNNPNYGGGG